MKETYHIEERNALGDWATVKSGFESYEEMKKYFNSMERDKGSDYFLVVAKWGTKKGGKKPVLLSRSYRETYL